MTGNEWIEVVTAWCAETRTPELAAIESICEASLTLGHCGVSVWTWDDAHHSRQMAAIVDPMVPYGEIREHAHGAKPPPGTVTRCDPISL